MRRRDEIINAINNEEDKILITKIIDYIEQVERYYEPRFTQFLDPAQIVKSKRVISQFSNIKYLAGCGLQNCERNIIAIIPDFLNENDVVLPVDALYIRVCTKFENIAHRDVLGAIMSQGIKREKIGDIIPGSDGFYVLMYSDISNYLKTNLQKIKHAPVNIDYVDLCTIPPKQENYKNIPANIASMRLDAVLSAGFGESRSSISKEIEHGNVKVNWEEVSNLSFIVHDGDTISLKGKGRIVIESVDGVTRKGRINVTIKKIM